MAVSLEWLPYCLIFLASLLISITLHYLYMKPIRAAPKPLPVSEVIPTVTSTKATVAPTVTSTDAPDVAPTVPSTPLTEVTIASNPQSDASIASAVEAPKFKENKKRKEAALQQRLLQASTRNGSPKLVVDSLLNIINDARSMFPDTINDIHISTVFHRLAIAVSNSNEKTHMLTALSTDKRLTSLIDLAVDRIPLTTPRVVSTIAWSASKLDIRRPALLNSLANYFEKNLSEFDGQGVANTLYAFALVQFKGGFIEKCSAHLPTRLNEMKPQEVANTAYAMARLGFGDYSVELFNRIGDFAANKLREYKAQECSNMVYAFSLVGVRHAAFLSAVEVELLRRGIKNCVCQDVSNTLYGFAKLRFPCHRLCAAVCSLEGITMLTSFSTQALSTTLSALAQLEYSCQDFIDAACTVFGTHLGNRQYSARIALSAQDVIYFTEALAKLKCDVPPSLVKEVTAFVLDSLWDLKTCDFISILHALVTLKADCAVLLDSCSDYAIAKMDDFRPAALTNLASALAASAHVNPRLLRALSRRALFVADRFRPQNLIALGCSLSLLAWKDDALFAKVEETFEVYSTILTFDDLCRVAVCLVRADQHDSLQRACWLISSAPTDGIVDTELLATLLRLFAKYKPPTAQAIEVLVTVLTHRMSDLASMDLVTCCSAITKLNHLVPEAVARNFFSALVEKALPSKLSTMNVAGVTALLRAISSFSSHEEGERALFFLQSWLPSRLNSVTPEEVQELVAALEPFAKNQNAALTGRE